MKIKNRKIAFLAIIASLVICISAEDAAANFDDNNFDPGKQVPAETHEIAGGVVKEVVEKAKEALDVSEKEPVQVKEGSVETLEKPTQKRIMEFKSGNVVSDEVVPAAKAEQSPATESQQNLTDNGATVLAQKPATSDVNPVVESKVESGKIEVVPKAASVEPAVSNEQNQIDSSTTSASENKEASSDNTAVPAPEQSTAPDVNSAAKPQEKLVEQNPTDPLTAPNPEQSVENSSQNNSNVTEPQPHKVEPTVELKDQKEETKDIAQDATQKNGSEVLNEPDKKGDGSEQSEQKKENPEIKPEPAWAQNIKEVFVEASADGVVAYAIYNGINAVERLGKLIVAVADDEVVEPDAQDGALVTQSETAKILISCASAGALRALLGESALAASVKQDGRVTVVVLATLIGNQLIVHGVPRAVTSMATDYPKTTIAAGISVAALAYWCKGAVAGWIEKQTATGVVGNNAVLIGACSIAAVSVGVTFATWAYNNYGSQKQN